MRRLVFVFVVLRACHTLRGQSDQNRADTPDHQKPPENIDLPRSSDPGKQAFVRTFVDDEIKIWTSPFRKSSYESHAFPKYVLPFTLVTGALIATDRQVEEALPTSPTQTTWSRRVSQIGAPYTLAGIAATMYFVSRKTGNKKTREVGFLGAVAIGHSQIFINLIKLATQRERPLEYKNNNHGGTGFFRGGDSFPSGHANSSFALATVFAYEYGREHRWVPFVSYGLASAVSASRLSGQKHWPSDIFVGATSGFLIGRFVYKSHHNPAYDSPRSTRARLLEPQLGVTAHGATVAWNW